MRDAATTLLLLAAQRHVTAGVTAGALKE